MAAESSETESIEHRIHPVLPLRDICLFPESSLQVVVARPGVQQAVEIARRAGGLLVAVAQKNPTATQPGPTGLNGVGTLAEIAAQEEVPEGLRLELDGRNRARLVTVIGSDLLLAEVEPLPEGDPGDEWGGAVETLARYLHSHQELRAFLDVQRRSKEPMAWVNLACQHLPITASARQKLLESDAVSRCQKINRGLDALLRKEQAS